MNKWLGIGRLTRDPELRYTNNGKEVGNMTIAVDRSYGDETDFINVTVWGKTAENCSKYLEKGRLIAVEGELNINKKGDKYYTKINASNVQFLDWGSDDKKQSNSSQTDSGNDNLEDNDSEFDPPF